MSVPAPSGDHRIDPHTVVGHTDGQILPISELDIEMTGGGVRDRAFGWLQRPMR